MLALFSYTSADSLLVSLQDGGRLLVVTLPNPSSPLSNVETAQVKTTFPNLSCSWSDKWAGKSNTSTNLDLVLGKEAECHVVKTECHL